MVCVQVCVVFLLVYLLLCYNKHRVCRVKMTEYVLTYTPPFYLKGSNSVAKSIDESSHLRYLAISEIIG